MSSSVSDEQQAKRAEHRAKRLRTGGPANQMHLRDLIALTVLHAMILKNSSSTSAEVAYLVADNMLRERNKE